MSRIVNDTTHSTIVLNCSRDLAIVLNEIIVLDDGIVLGENAFTRMHASIQNLRNDTFHKNILDRIASSNSRLDALVQSVARMEETNRENNRELFDGLVRLHEIQISKLNEICSVAARSSTLTLETLAEPNETANAGQTLDASNRSDRLDDAALSLNESQRLSNNEFYITQYSSNESYSTDRSRMVRLGLYRPRPNDPPFPVQPDTLAPEMVEAHDADERLERNIEYRMHLLQPRQRPEDLYSSATLIERYGEPIRLSGEEYFRLPVDIFNGYTLRLAYFVSRSGRLASYRTENWNDRLFNELEYQFMAGSFHNGYIRMKFQVHDHRDGVSRYLHVIVARMYLVPPVDHDVVRYDARHRENNTRDNRVQNLEWVLHRTNAIYGCGIPVVTIEVPTGVIKYFDCKKDCYMYYAIEKKLFNDILIQGIQHGAYRFEVVTRENRPDYNYDDLNMD